jgi:membrane protein YqaA with SNARE-associated domain
MEYFPHHHSLTGLFLLSFMAATILPLGSEWFLVALLLRGLDPVQLVSIATIGNFLGGVTTYGIGYYGSGFITEKILRISEKDTGKAMNLYQKYGSWSLLLSWVPIIGDPLCLVAGSLKLHPFRFSVFVLIGKWARYTLIAYTTIQAATII